MIDVEGKMKKRMDPLIKTTLKQAGFAWNRLDNRTDGQRVEIYEHKNKGKDQF